MATYPLNDEFLQMHAEIALGDRALIAIAAHVEVRAVLRSSDLLRLLGLDDILIGSYARKVANWPGKDVDVLGRLTRRTVTTITPDEAYDAFLGALTVYDDAGRLVEQPRSLKIEFGRTRLPSADFLRVAAAQYGWSTARVRRVESDLPRLAFEFSVDVVPGVPWDGHYGIPELARDAATGTRRRSGSWRLTDPVELTELTKRRNRAPRLGGVGAFVRTTKSVKQVKSAHLDGVKPSALFYEFLLHEGFETGAIAGDSWADLTASALSFIAQRLATVATSPVCDPVLQEPYLPTPTPADLARAQAVFEEMARYAARAVGTDDRCQAALYWRHVFGGNARTENVFPLPTGCRGGGGALGAAAANAAVGGSRERSFGDRRSRP